MAAAKTLEGTVALVTGASSGIGEATARRLAAEGAAVSLVARRADRLEQLGGEIADAGGTALPIEADVSEREQAQGAVGRAVEELGRLDVLVNNAGVMLLGPIAEAPVGEWEQMIQVNLLGLLYTAHAAIPHLALVEPGAVATELQSHNRPEVRGEIEKRFENMEVLQAEDIADAIAYVVTRPRHTAVNEILIRPTEQEL